jgi:hypothetical protein
MLKVLLKLLEVDALLTERRKSFDLWAEYIFIISHLLLWTLVCFTGASSCISLLFLFLPAVSLLCFLWFLIHWTKLYHLFYIDVLFLISNLLLILIYLISSFILLLLIICSLLIRYRLISQMILSLILFINSINNSSLFMCFFSI